MFKRNMGSKERVARMILGALLICTGVVAMHASVLGIAVAAVGSVSLFTGIQLLSCMCGCGTSADRLQPDRDTVFRSASAVDEQTFRLAQAALLHHIFDRR